MPKKKKSPGRTAGLTDDPKQRRAEHGNPEGWNQVRRFRTEKEAREWEEKMLAQEYDGGTGGAGWRYGYTFKTPKKKR